MSSNVTSLPLTQPIREEASVWIAKLERGLDHDEEQALTEWANLSPLRYDTLMKMASLWDSMGVLNELSSLFPLEEVKPQTSSPFSFGRMAVAASVLMCLGLSGFWLSVKDSASTPTYPSQYLTSLGEHTTEHLSDGSVLQLNTNSLIKIDFTPSERHITLVRGEVHFEVAHNPDRPFIVEAGGKTVRAVGTAFNVHMEEGADLEVVVTEGKVMLSKLNALVPATGFVVEPGNNDAILLKAGEKVALPTDHPGSIAKLEIEQLKVDDLESELAWQQGFLVFEGEALESVLEEVSRYSDVSFELASPSMTHIRVAGFYKTRDVAGLLDSLQENFDIHHEIGEQNHIILSTL